MATTFMQLPCELRAMIWDEAMPEDIPEVCILPPEEEDEENANSDQMDDDSEDDDEDEPCLSDESSLTVDTAFSYRHPVSALPPGARRAIRAARADPSSPRTLPAPLSPRAPRRPGVLAAPVHGGAAATALGGLRVYSVPARRGHLHRGALVQGAAFFAAEWEAVRPLAARRCRLEPYYTGAAGKTNIIAAFCNNREGGDDDKGRKGDWRELGPRHGDALRGGGGFVDLSLAAQYFAAWAPDVSPGNERRGSFLDSLQFPEGFVQPSKCS
ncbi:hypothetical protein G7054_g9948 [Neopestalotiopsis clavispora]|nr:hypothetical protein G7054_g9948 [Neopestalotiopsis clavispora]